MVPHSFSAVSVVIPCFRCTRTLERAIASVAAQTLRPAEVILVDDASGDETRELMKEIQRRFGPSWIKLIFLDENVGAGSARNAGWRVAKEPYIAFLDSDDSWHARKIEIQFGYMKVHPDVVLSGHEVLVLRQDVLPSWDVSLDEVKIISKMAMLLSNQFVTPSVMIKRDAGFRFIEEQRYMEDHMLWLSIVCSGRLVVKLSSTLTAIYKESFGVAGLSSRMWLMECGDLRNYHRLYIAGHLNFIQFVLLAIFSLLKFFRRLILYAGYLRWKKL